MNERAELPDHLLNQLRMTMPQRQHARTVEEVDENITIQISNKTASSIRYARTSQYALMSGQSGELPEG
jgi:hypothetical protein